MQLSLAVARIPAWRADSLSTIPVRNGMDAHFLIRHPSAKVVVALLTTRHRKGHPEMKITTIGIDLAKIIFQIHGVDERGKVAVRKQLKRAEMSSYFANLEPCLIGEEA
jgi:hypothetical protein